MSRMYQFFKQGTRIFYKIRHHRGHGIHSPFVFSLINDVIEEKRPYYSYSDISAFLLQTANITDCNTKVNKLLFRLVNRFNPSNILEIGSGCGISTLYITSKSKECECFCIGANNEAKSMHRQWKRKIKYLDDLFSNMLRRQDFIYVNLNNINYNEDRLAKFLKSHVHIQSVIVVDGIRKNKAKQMFWKRLITSDSVRISLDLYDIGILFFDRKYLKKNYKLSF